MLLAAAACAVVGVGVAGASSARSPDPKLLVLRLSDLPVGFGRVSGYYANNVRAAKETKTISLSDYMRWGRITGYEEEFRRSSVTGLIDILAQASTYSTASGAGQSLQATYRAALTEPKVVQVSMGRTIGNDSRAYSYTTKSALVYIVAWRWKTVKATVFGAGVLGTVQPEPVIALAHKQQKRIRAQVP
jgi:hypothetical protein